MSKHIHNHFKVENTPQASHWHPCAENDTQYEQVNEHKHAFELRREACDLAHHVTKEILWFFAQTLSGGETRGQVSKIHGGGNPCEVILTGVPPILTHQIHPRPTPKTCKGSRTLSHRPKETRGRQNCEERRLEKFACLPKVKIPAPCLKSPSPNPRRPPHVRKPCPRSKLKQSSHSDSQTERQTKPKSISGRVAQVRSVRRSMDRGTAKSASSHSSGAPTLAIIEKGDAF